MTPDQPTPQADRLSTPLPLSATAEDAPPAGRFPTFRKAGQRTRKFAGKVWQRTRRGLRWLVITLVVIHLSFNLLASLQLNRELGEMRQYGEPLTLAELVPSPVPDALNAAKIYQRADGAIPKPVQRILRGDDVRYETLTRPELASCQAAVALTRHVAAMPQCSFPHKIQDPFTDAMPQLSMLRKLARLIRYQALQEAHDGRIEPALADTRVIFAISHHLAAEPTLIGWLTAVAVASTGYRTLDEMLPQTRLTPAQGRAVLQGLPGTDWSQALSHTMTSERAMGLWAFEALRSDPDLAAKISGGGVPYQPRSLVAGWLIRLLALIWSPMAKLDEIQYLRFMKRAAMQDLRLPFLVQATSPDTELDNIPSYAVFTHLIAPVYSRILINRDRVVTLSQLAEVAVALNVYRTAHGHYPATLKEAEPTWGHPLPLDPYSHMPFIYHPEGAKFALYSVGPNGRDDGWISDSNDKDDISLNPSYYPRNKQNH